MRLLILVLLSLAAMTAAPARLAEAGFEEGVAAYEREDYVTALRELLPIARGGDGVAQSYVGIIYQYGLGTKADLATAVEWYNRAADNGDSLARRIIGDLYFEGAWGRPDFPAAAKWYELAAESGDTEAQRKLGEMYLKGQGVPRDERRAAKWLQQAAARDDRQARDLLRDTYVERRPQQRALRTPDPAPSSGISGSRCKGGFADAPYDINVQIVFPKVRIDHSKSIRQLGQISGLGHNKRTLGLMRPDLVIETRPHAQGLKVGGKFCFWITGFDVTLRYRRVDVFIAREYPVGSCNYRAIMDHEQDHVRVARRNLQEFAPRIRRALTSMLIPTGQEPVMVASAKEARANVRGISDELLKPVYREMMQSLRRAQAEVDTPAEYAKVQRRCRRW